MSFEREMDWMGDAGASTDTGDDIEETSFITGTDGDDVPYMPDVPMVPPSDIQRTLVAHGDRIQELREELRRSALEDQKKRLVDTFHKEVNCSYGLRLPKGRAIDYRQFGTGYDGKMLFWEPGDGKRIRMTTMRGIWFQYLKISTLLKEVPQKRCGLVGALVQVREAAT